jgi:hypothetical protein
VETYIVEFLSLEARAWLVYRKQLDEHAQIVQVFCSHSGSRSQDGITAVRIIIVCYQK